MIIIYREEIKRYGYSSIQKLIANIPGIYNIETHFGPPGTFGVRGLWKDSEHNQNILFMINGIKTSNLTIPVEAIDRVEIVRGPISTIYGMNAFFGSINFITNAAQNENGSLLSSSTSLSGPDSRKTFFRYASKNDSTATVINAMVRYTDGPQMRIENISDVSRLTGFVATAVETAGLQRKETLAIEEGYFQLSSRLEKLDIDLKYSHYETGIDFIMPSVGDKGSIETQDNLTIASNIELNLSPTITGNLQAAYTYTNKHLDIVTKHIDSYAFQNLTTYDMELDGRLFWTPVNANLVLSSGIYLNRFDEDRFSDTVSPGLMNQKNIMEPKQTWALFSQLDYSIADFKVVGGVRLQQIKAYQRVFTRNNGFDFWNEYFGVDNGSVPFSDYEFTEKYSEDEKIYVIPRLALIYAPDDTHAFKWIYGKGMQDNEFPKAEELETFEFSYSLSGSKLYSSYNLFYNRFKNLLLISPTLAPNGTYSAVYSFEDKKETTGAELLFKVEPLARVELELALTWQHTTDADNMGGVAYSPDVLGYVKGSYQSNSYSVSVNATYVDSMLSYNNGNGGRIGDAAAAYTLVDLNFRANNVLNTGIFANLRVENAFDKAWRYPTTLDNAWANRGYLGFGRLAMLQIGYEF